MSEASCRLRKRAADIIKRHGWTQGSYGNHDRGFCIWGALLEAFPEPLPMGTFYEVVDDLEREIQGGRLPHWNDEPDRTKEQVIAALENCQP